MTADETREALKLALALQDLLRPQKHIGHKQQAWEICAELVKMLESEPKGEHTQ